MTNELNTVDKIAKDIFEQTDEQTLMELFASKSSGIIQSSFTMAFKMWIRNHYQLWGDSPLTKRWRTDEDSRDIRDGVDYSEDHPDQVSEDIFQRVKVLYENGYCRQSAV